MICRPDCVRPEVDRRADGDAPHVTRLLDLREHDLVELVRVGQELVVVDLEEERDLVRVLPRDGAEDAERRGDGVAAPLDRGLHDPLRVEADGVLREAGAGRVLDPLVDREDREVAGPRRGARGRRAAAGSSGRGSAGRTCAQIRSTTSGPGRWSVSFGIPVQVCSRRDFASPPSAAVMVSIVLMCRSPRVVLRDPPILSPLRRERTGARRRRLRPVREPTGDNRRLGARRPARSRAGVPI